MSLFYAAFLMIRHLIFPRFTWTQHLSVKMPLPALKADPKSLGVTSFVLFCLLLLSYIDRKDGVKNLLFFFSFFMSADCPDNDRSRDSLIWNCIKKFWPFECPVRGRVLGLSLRMFSLSCFNIFTLLCWS